MAYIVVSLFPIKDFSALLKILLLFPCLAVGAKRCHDRGRSGLLQVLPYAPLILGSLALGGRNSGFGEFLVTVGVIALAWVSIEMGILRGTPGPNRFGPDPLQGSTP